MLEQLQELKWLPAPSLSSASSPSLTLSPLIVIHLPCQKDALLSHFAKVAKALSPSTLPPLTTFSSRQTTALANQNEGTQFNGDIARGYASHGLGATSLTV
jgi:hypothetical protein